jgi:tRNA/rRNA methyltransferase
MRSRLGALYNRSLLTESQRDRIGVVLVSPRNPLNIGAVARAMANFGFLRLSVAAAFALHWREARSAVGAPHLLETAQETATLAEAVRDCTLVLGTGTVTHRKPEQPVMRLDALANVVERELDRGGRIAVVLGPEKHGLTRDDLSLCHLLVEIPTDAGQPSMNLGQAAAVLLYEIATRAGARSISDNNHPSALAGAGKDSTRAPSGDLENLARIVGDVMTAAGYSPRSMQGANAHDLRVMLRRLHLNGADVRRAMGFFRRILSRLNNSQK